jgi:hypothetical protein
MRTLKDIVDNRMIFESYPIAFLEEHKQLTPEETLETLSNIVRFLHRLDDKIGDHQVKDLVDVKFYLTELYYELKIK